MTNIFSVFLQILSNKITTLFVQIFFIAPSLMLLYLSACNFVIGI
jgi:hypothetical protein